MTLPAPQISLIRGTSAWIVPMNYRLTACLSLIVPLFRLR